METGFIVTYYNHGWRTNAYVCARPGWYRLKDGSFSRDNPNSGPEWSVRREEALVFKSHRSAARVANVCAGVSIVEA